MSDRIFEAIKNHVTIEDDPLTLEAFEQLIKKAETSNHQHPS